ncbi:cytochrome P450 [Mesorhizobium huakuii]|uniref:Cytochrome P450 n=1 Tax=Mesorhizobium huakuii TaxID=28104 RepID=A0ABZ0VP46_9HYPH|nr:cytochrome P450 [Mesorhizobium huakuii]WQB99000.1 cytochrome P450 [Mesorhizobium huakuii]
MDNQAQIESVLNNLVYALFAQSGQIETNGKAGNLGNLIVFDNPEAVDTIVKAPELFRKNFSLISALGFSRFNTNGEDWSIRRAITQDTYLAAARPAQQQPMAELYATALAESDATLPSIQQALFAVSMTIFYRAFGLVPDMAATLLLLDRVRDVLRRLQYYSWVSPTSAERANVIQGARAVVADFTSLLMSDPRAVAEMDRFRNLASDLEDFSPVEEFVMNFFAGVETTVTTALWVIDRLGANQQVQERIHAEVLSGLAQTPYTDCMINETMRYFPPIPFLTREVGADTVLDGQKLYAGQLIMVSIVGVHQNPAYWSNPRVFDASRKEFLENSFDRRAFIPFLTGPRMCGGARLGRLEVREAVLAIVRQFAFGRADDVIRFDYALALRPAQGASVSVSRR